MNVNQIVNMVTRMVMRKLVNRGVNAGIDLASRKGKAPDEMTQEERNTASAAKQNARRSRQAMRMMRRMR